MKALLLIDAANLYYFANRKYPNSKINYAALLEKAREEATITRAIAFGTQRDNRAGKFVDALQFIGFETKFKDTNTSRSTNNVEIAMDVVRATDYDEVYLYSSDNDLEEVLRWARDAGLAVHLRSFGFNPTLRNLAASYKQLDDELLETQ